MCSSSVGGRRRGGSRLRRRRGLRALVVEDIAWEVRRERRAESRTTWFSNRDLWRGPLVAWRSAGHEVRARFAIPLRVTTLGGARGTVPSAPPSRMASASVRCNRSRERGAVSATSAGTTRRFRGLGVYYSATEMEARYCKDTEAVIIGAAILPVKLRCSYAAIQVRPCAGARFLARRFDVELSPSRLEADPVSRLSTTLRSRHWEAASIWKASPSANAEPGSRGRLRHGRYLSWWCRAKH